jgi:hypothetical protein
MAHLDSFVRFSVERRPLRANTMMTVPSTMATIKTTTTLAQIAMMMVLMED